MLQYTHNLFEHDRIRKQAKLILIRLLIGGGRIKYIFYIKTSV
jgi:hypothetical protein